MKTLTDFSSCLTFLVLLCLLNGCIKDDDNAPEPEVPQPTVGNKLSGTVKAIAGETVAGTYVMACFNNDCEDERTKYVQLSQEQANAPFEITDLAAGKYSVVAWKDNNANQELDAGDGLGMVSTNGEDPDLITPTKEDLVLQLVLMPGSGSGSGGNTGGPGSISGTVAAASGENVEGTIVIACHWNGTECVESTSQLVQAQPNGTYTISGLVSEPYYVIAWKDLNNNGGIDGGDLYGLHIEEGSIGSVVPPSQHINVTMAITSEQGNTGGGGSGSVPASLVGDWIYGTAGAVDFYNPSTGSWAPPSGRGMYLQLFADGTFELSTVVQVSNYNCTTQVTTFYSGAAVFNGNHLNIEPSYTRQKYHSNCYSQYNSDKEVPNSPLPFTWRLGTDANGKQELVLIWPDGEEYFFSRP